MKSGGKAFLALHRETTIRLAISGVLLLLVGASISAAAGLPDWYDAAWADSVTQRLLNVPDEKGKLPDVVRVLDDYRLDVRDGREETLRKRRVVHVRKGSGAGESGTHCYENFWRNVKGMTLWQVAADGAVSKADDVVKSQLGSELYDDGVLHSLMAREFSDGATLLFETEEASRLTDESCRYFPVPEDVPVGRWTCSVLHEPGVRATAAWLLDPESAPVSVPPTTSEEKVTGWQLSEIPDDAEVFVVRLETDDEVRFGIRSWEDIALWYRSLAGQSLAGAPDVEAKAAELVAGCATPDDRVRTLAEYVQQSVAYVQVYLDDGGWRPHPVDETLANRFGDCKDMSMLVVGLLTDAGIESYPALTNVEDDVRVPFPARRFDHCIVAYRDSDGPLGWGFFDPTSKSTPFGSLPAQIEGKSVLVAGVTPPIGLLELPESSSGDNTASYDALVRVREDGGMEAEVVERRTGHSAFGLKAHLKELSEAKRTEWLEDRLSGRKLDAKVDSLALVGLEADSDTLELRYFLSAERWAKRAGSRLIAGPDFLSSRTAKRLDEDDDHPEFSFPFRVDTHIAVEYPEGWTVESLPDDVELGSESASYVRRSIRGDGRIEVVRSEVLNAVRPRDDELAAIREWDDAAYQADRKQVILTR